MLDYVHFGIKLVDIIIQCKTPTSFEKVILFSIDRKIKKNKKRKRLGLGKGGLCRIRIICF